MNSWIIYYVLLDDGSYFPELYGSNIVPTKNYDKVITVPEEIARQAGKFDFDGKTLTRKTDQYILTKEQLDEKENQDEISLWGEVPPHLKEPEKDPNEIEIKF